MCLTLGLELNAILNVDVMFADGPALLRVMCAAVLCVCRSVPVHPPALVDIVAASARRYARRFKSIEKGL